MQQGSEVEGLMCKTRTNVFNLQVFKFIFHASKDHETKIQAQNHKRPKKRCCSYLLQTYAREYLMTIPELFGFYQHS